MVCYLFLGNFGFFVFNGSFFLVVDLILFGESHARTYNGTAQAMYITATLK
jgi:hypothetical protein